MCLIWAVDPHQDFWCHGNRLNIDSYSFIRLKTTQWHMMMCFPESSEPVCEDRAGQLDDGDQLGRLHVWPDQAGVRVFRSGSWKPLLRLTVPVNHTCGDVIMMLVCVDVKGPWEKADSGADFRAAHHLSSESVSESSSYFTLKSFNSAHLPSHSVICTDDFLLRSFL